MTFKVIIPARYESTRLPGKPLLKLGKHTLIEHVYNRAMESQAEQIIVATDDNRIAEEVSKFGAQVEMTSSEHNSGTERIAEVIARLDIAPDEIVINLQCDEPCMPGRLIDQVAHLLDNSMQASVATLAEVIDSRRDLNNPNVVKVVCDKTHHALYFSRATIPMDRDNQYDFGSGFHYLKHIGLYAYRAGYITQYVRLAPSPIERLEALEQLRVLWHGGKIAVAEAEVKAGPGVDTEAELDLARQWLANLGL